MNRELFLKKLYNQLRWELPLGEAIDIVSDYNEYFTEGLTLGKTEQQLCMEFGIPKQIAASILKERGGLRRLKLGVYRWAVAILIILFYPVLVLWGDFFGLLYSAIDWLRYVYVVAASILIILFIGLWQIPNNPTHASRRESLLCGGLILFSLLSTSICTFFVYDFLKDMVTTYPDNVIEKIYPIINVCTISILMIAVAWLITVLFASSTSMYFPCVYFLYSGFLAGIFDYLYYFSSMNFDEAFTDFIMEIVFTSCIKLFVSGVLCAAVWCIFVNLCYRKSRKV